MKIKCYFGHFLSLTALALAVVTPVEPAIAQAETDRADFSKSIGSIVRVLAVHGDGSAAYGTGWVIEAASKENAGAAVIVTALHVVAGASRVTIVESGSEIGNQKAASVKSVAIDRDLAFLEVKDLTAPALPLTRKMSGLSDEVAAAGYTSASDANEAEGRAKIASVKRGGLSKVFRGTVNKRAQAPIDQIEFDAPILAGFSGGPVMNRCGRVIGMTITDGGHINISEGASIAIAQGVATAVAADELLKVARDNGVTPTAFDSACGEDATEASPPPPPPAPCESAFTSQLPSGAPCTPKQPTTLEKIIHNLQGSTAIIASVAILLLIIIAAVLILLRRNMNASADENDFDRDAPLVPPSGGTPPSEPIGSDIYGKDSAASSTRARAGKSIRLTGRGPAGETIDLRFMADELVGGGVMLGTGTDVQGRIPDNRTNRFVSGRHAILGYDGQNFTIEDNKSTNKTKVADVTLTPNVKRTLASGETISLADVALHVMID